jgi:hypothetical protein
VAFAREASRRDGAHLAEPENANSHVPFLSLMSSAGGRIPATEPGLLFACGRIGTLVCTMAARWYKRMIPPNDRIRRF